MTPAALPRTVRAVDTDQLLALQQAAAARGFSQWLEVGRLREHLAAEATHHLFPMLVHELGHRPEVSPRWRCQVLLTVGTGERILGLLDVLPDTFDEIPETLDTAAKSDIARRMDQAVSVRERSDRTAGIRDPRRGLNGVRTQPGTPSWAWARVLRVDAVRQNRWHEANGAPRRLDSSAAA